MDLNMQQMDPTETWDINDKYLRLKKRCIKKLITLPPKYLGNLNKGIEDAIFKSNQEIYKEFDGVPISMGKKTLLQNTGTCIDDHAFIQFYVDIECVVFQPKVDKKVRGTVNKIGDSYVGCLICGRINATIFKKAKKPKASAHLTEEQKCENQLNSLSIGQSVLIKIKSIQQEQNNLFIIATFVNILE